MKVFFVLCAILVTSNAQNRPPIDPPDTGDVPFDPNADDIPGLPSNPDDVSDGRPWRPQSNGEQGSPIRRQLINFMSMLGQIFNDTQKMGGKLGGVGDLIKDLRDVINEDDNVDIIDSFTDFLQIANEHLGSLGIDVQYNVTAIVGVLQEIKRLAEAGNTPSQELRDRYVRLLMEPLQSVFGPGRGTPGLNPGQMGPNRQPPRRARGCSDIRSVFPELGDSIEVTLMQARSSVGGLIEHIGSDGLPMACIKEILAGFRRGQCNPSHVRSAVCKTDADPEVLRGFLDCLEREDVCRTLEQLKTTDCVTDSPNRGSLAGLLLTYGCGDRSITVDVLARAPLSVIQRHVQTLQAEDLIDLLHEFKGDISLLEEMSCDKRRFLARTVNRVLFTSRNDPQSRLAVWKDSMDELLNGLYVNKPIPTTDEVVSALSNKLEELSGVVVAVGETGLELPDFESILQQIRTALERSKNPEEVDLEGMLSPVDDFVGRLRSDSSQITETLTEIVEELKPLLPYMPREVCSRIPASMIMDHLEELGSQNFRCSVVKGPGMCADDDQCGRAIVATLLRHNDINLGDEERRQMLGNLLACVPKQQLRQMAEPGDCAHFVPGFTPTGMLGRTIARQCLPENKDVSEMDRTDVTNMGCLLTQLGLTALRQIPHDAVCNEDVLPNLIRCIAESGIRDNSMARYLGQRCSGAQVTRDTVKDLGPAVVQASQQALQGLRQQDLSDPEVRKDVVDGIKQICEENQRDCVAKARIILEKLNDLTTASRQKSLMRAMSLNQFKEQIGSDEGLSAVKEALNLDEGNDPRGLEASQRQFVVKLLMSEVTHPSQVTEDELKKIGSVVLGLSSDLMLQLNSFFRLWLVQRFGSFEGWNQQQVTALRTMLEEGLIDLTENRPWSQLAVDMIQDIHPDALLGLIADDIEAMTNETCEAVCRKFDRSNNFCENVPPLRRQAIAEACLKCLNAVSKDQLDEDDVNVLGESLLVSLNDESIMDKIPNEILARKAKLFRRLSHMKASFIQKLIARITSAVAERIEREAGDVDYDALAEDLGVWALALTGEVKENIREALLNNIDNLKELLRMNKDFMSQLQVGACRQGWTEADMTDADRSLQRLRTALFELVKDSGLDTDSPVWRRRRDTEWVPTCVQLKSMGEASVELTTDQIRVMQTSEVDNCMDTIGNMEIWSDDQYTAWAEKFSQVTGHVCSLSSTDLQRMGSVAYTLTDNEISCLDNLDDDAVASLGALSQWSEIQLAAFASQYQIRSNLPSPNKLTASHITNMGHFVCGLTASDIDLIPNEVYEATSSIIGNLQTCGSEQLEALARQAETLYGDASQWDSATYADVGIVIGGLDGDDLATATYQEIEVWPVNAVSHIKPDALKELNADQLGWFSRPQAEAVTTEQKAALSKEGKEALDGAANSIVDAEDNTNGNNVKKVSSAGHLQAGLVCVILCMFISVFH